MSLLLHIVNEYNTMRPKLIIEEIKYWSQCCNEEEENIIESVHEEDFCYVKRIQVTNSSYHCFQ